MGKYWQVIKNSWSESTAYRLNFILWRVRRVVNLLLVYFLWHAVTAGKNTLFGYNESQILTYVLLSNVVTSFILATKTLDIGDEINSGNLTNYLLKPINYFSLWWAKDAADKALNVFFSILEVVLLIFFLKPQFILQTNVLFLLFFTLSMGLGMILYFYLSVLLGFIGFYSPEVWAPRFVFFVISQFFIGSLFPLDILPKWLYLSLQALPFPYLLFFPLKIYLGQLNVQEISIGIAISLVWIIILKETAVRVWNKGLLDYSAQGR